MKNPQQVFYKYILFQKQKTIIFSPGLNSKKKKIYTIL